ncbi:MAG TPA: 50S ribosomal protein L21 [Candidatus Paceibacterota bacterium]
MVKYAVIQTGGKQYRVSEGDTVTVEKLSSLLSPIKEGEAVIFDKVLLTDDGTATQVGAPYLAGAKVEGTLVSEKKGKKVLGMKYKAKSNYRIKYGHRQTEAKVKITTVG